MGKKELKTNAMRILERQKIPFTYETYECEEFMDGIHVADQLGFEHKYVYKTLVTTGKSGEHYVFVIPIEEEIDFKKAAKAVGEKSVEMLPLKNLTKVTGYVRGGCTAIGMKKQFVTVIQEEAKELKSMPCQWRKAWNADYVKSAGFTESGECTICRCHSRRNRRSR